MTTQIKASEITSLIKERIAEFNIDAQVRTEGTIVNLKDGIVRIYGLGNVMFGEMIAFPFSNAFAVERSKKGNQGEYMALYAISFSLSHIFSHNAGMQIVDRFGYEFTWNFIALLGLLGVFILIVLSRVLKRENN